MHRVAFLALGLVLVCAVTAQAQNITEIRLDGLDHVNRAAVHGQLQSKVGQEMNIADVREDLRRILTLGVFEPGNSGFEFEDREDGVAIIFTLAENPVIEKVVLAGVTVLAVDVEAIQAAADELYPTGQIFNYNTAGRLEVRVAGIYEEAGYYATIKPPAILTGQGQDGQVIVTVIEAVIEDVVLSVWPPVDYLDLDALVKGAGFHAGSAVNDAQLEQAYDWLMMLGIFFHLTFSWEPSDVGVIVYYTGVLNDYPTLSPEGVAFIDPTKLLESFPVYKTSPPPYSQVTTPRATPLRLGRLKGRVANTPDDAAAAAALSLELARAGYVGEALVAAEAALPLVEAEEATPANVVTIARLSMLLGNPARAYAALDLLRQDGSLPPEGYPTLIQASAYVLADSVAGEGDAARVPGDTLAWTIKTILADEDWDTLLATEAGADYCSALAGAWETFKRMDDGSIGREFAAYERFLATLIVLEYLPPQFQPTQILPESAEMFAATPIDPVFNSARLLNGLKSQDGESDKRYAWASCIVQRELLVALSGEEIRPTEDRERHAEELLQAQHAITMLLEEDPIRYSGARTLQALGFLAQGNPSQALDLLASLLDTGNQVLADHLYLLATQMSVGTPETEAEAQAGIESAADRLSTLIADGGTRPRARSARCALIAWAGSTDRALSEARAAIALEPRDAPTWASIGFFEAKLGNVDEAVTALEEAMELDPTDAHAAYVYGLVLWLQSGDPIPSLPYLARLGDESPIDISARDIAF